MTRPPRISRTAARPIVCEFSMFSSSMLALSSSAAWVRGETTAASRWALSRRAASAAARPLRGVPGSRLASRWGSGAPNPGVGSDVGSGAAASQAGACVGRARCSADRGHVGGGRGLGRGPRVRAVVEVHGRAARDHDRVAPAGRGRRGVRGGLDGSVVEDGGRGRLGLRRCARRLLGGLRVARVAEDREGVLARGCVAARGRGL